MTICGLFLDGLDHAVIWADSEVYRAHGTAPYRHMPKLALNALACAAGTGRGLQLVLRDADEALGVAAIYDDVPELVTKALRLATSRAAGVFDKDPHTSAPTYITVGWSGSAGRMLAHEYDIGNWYSPMLTATYFSPAVARSEVWRPLSEHEFLSMAREQVEEFRKLHSGTGTGTLTVADLRPGRLSTIAYAGFALGANATTLEDLPCSSTDFSQFPPPAARAHAPSFRAPDMPASRLHS